ncbi:methyltransferase domain-containing protein [Nocardioides sp. BP30]|uniref:class I SAM-dependent methyltransferase n=1 Tax=Nocardioides sp. BP30 TaxID=3036374 RepID=UPI002469A3F9|nr:class I SAM-dependent methyltransferase [Nocardioides sp. BP30]WGL53686.1 methyltransferase domain-containing protein [Nocardioides sp. BP30]
MDLRKTLATALQSAGFERSGTSDRLRDRIRALEKRNAKLVERVERLRKRREAIERQVEDMRRRAEPTAVVEEPGVSRLDLRRRCALADSAESPSILEIGPAHNAIFPKRDGFRTRTVDYLDRDGLIKRYEDFAQYSPDDIEEVDYVLAPGAAMADVIPDRFDVVMASHVIEHTTSLIDFLNECTKLLAPGGVLALVVPDHRYCFDRFRERASLARVIDASLAPPAVHTPGTVIEERLNAVSHRGTTAWAPGHRGRYRFVHDLEHAKGLGEEARRADRYIDTHNWIFTPHHLRLLLRDLHALGLITLRETSFHDTVKHEFFLNLSVDGPGPGLLREELTALADDERRTLDAAEFEEPSA